MKCFEGLILYSTFADLLGYIVIAPFFPPQLQERALNPLYNSIVFSIYAVSYVGCSLAISQVVIPRFGRSGSFLIGALFQLISMMMLGSLYYIGSNTPFLVTAIFARIIQGAGSSIMVTISFALTSLTYP